MVVFQDGCAFDITPDDLKDYLRSVAGGQAVTLEQFSIEVGDYLGDFTDMSPALARVLQGALAANALGRSASGDLSILAQLVASRQADLAANKPPRIRHVAA